MSPPFLRCRGLERERVHLVLQQVGERGVNRAMTLDRRKPAERLRDDHARIMSPAAGGTGVADVLSAVIDDLEMSRSKRFAKLRLDAVGRRHSSSVSLRG